MRIVKGRIGVGEGIFPSAFRSWYGEKEKTL